MALTLCSRCSFRLFRDAINREAELGCITRDGEMEVIVALWQEEMKNLCRNRENKDTISTAPSPWDLSGVPFCWEDIKSPEKCADVEPFPTEKTSKSTHFFLKSLVKLRLINGRYLLIDFFPPTECEYPKICAVKTQQCSIFSIFRIMQEKGCNILAPTKKNYIKYKHFCMQGNSQWK